MHWSYEPCNDPTARLMAEQLSSHEKFREFQVNGAEHEQVLKDSFKFEACAMKEQLITHAIEEEEKLKKSRQMHLSIEPSYGPYELGISEQLIRQITWSTTK